MWIYNTPLLEKEKITAMMTYARHIGIETLEIQPTTDLFPLKPDFVFGSKNLVMMASDMWPESVHYKSIGMSERLNSTFGADNVLNPVFTDGYVRSMKSEEPMFVTFFDHRKPRVASKNDIADMVLRLETQPWKPVRYAPVQKILAEYRFFVVNRQIVTQSRYALNGEMSISRHVPDWVQEWADGMADRIDGYYVLDVADTPGGLRVIETNTLNMSGLYDCDIVRLTHALKEYHS